MTKITIISGFLGAGKTTFITLLLNHIFRDEKCVLIENEFGDASVDARLLDSSTALTVTELNSGCICCSLSGQLSTAVSEIIKTYAPDRIIIEPSGVARLSDLIKTIHQLSDIWPLHLDPSMTILGTAKSPAYLKQFQSILRNQIQYTDLVILRPDIYNTIEKINAVEMKLRSIRNDLTVFHMPWEPEVLKHYLQPIIAAIPAGTHLLPVFELPPAANGLNYYTLYPQKSFSRDQLIQLLLLFEKEFPERLLRLKGFVKSTEGGLWHVEYSLSGCTVTPTVPTEADHIFLNAIGVHLQYSILYSHFCFSVPRIHL